MRPELLHCIVTPVTARVTIYLNLSWSKSKFSAYTCGYYLVSRGWGRYRAYAELTTYTYKCRSASMNSSETLPILDLGKYLLIILLWIRRLLALFQFSEEVTVWRKTLRDWGPGQSLFWWLFRCETIGLVQIWLWTFLKSVSVSYFDTE